MDTRINGKLKTWDEARGFGFITPLNGGQDVFVHISDYPKRGGPPKVGEPISFEVALNKDGKKRPPGFNGQAWSQPASDVLAGRPYARETRYSAA